MSPSRGVSQLRSEALQLLRAGMQSTDGEGREVAADATSSKRRNAARAAYCAAVSSRSSMRDRLHATTLLGEPAGIAG